MNPALRVVTRLPLDELWDGGGVVDAQRTGQIDTSAVRRLLAGGPVPFVVADVGMSLRWICGRERFAFWKRDARPRVVPPNRRVRIEEFPGNFCYAVVQWARPDGSPVLVFEKWH